MSKLCFVSTNDFLYNPLFMMQGGKFLPVRAIVLLELTTTQRSRAFRTPWQIGKCIPSYWFCHGFFPPSTRRKARALVSCNEMGLCL